ncbi:MAG: NADH-quinone oxidoreductase subunit N, partial [Bacteroidetes bacterium]
MFSKYLVENLSYQLNNLFNSFTYLGGEYCLLIGIFFLILIELRPKSAPKNIALAIAVMSICASIFWLFISFRNISPKGQYLFGEMLFLNSFNIKIKILFGFIGFLTFIFLACSSIYKQKKFPFSEWFLFILTIELGLYILVASQNLLAIYISLEIISLVSYILVALPFKKENAEASIKYLLFGAFTTGITLYGMSLLYGLTGSLDMNLTVININFNAVKTPLWLIAFFLTCGSLFFKISSLPFHFWTPDVYQGAPSWVTSFMSTAVKTAGFAALFRLFNYSFLPLSGTWFVIFSILAAISITVGTFSAVFQTSLKRILAFSSIAHAGYMLIILLNGENTTGAGLLFYTLAYSIASLVAFATIVAVEGSTGN